MEYLDFLYGLAFFSLGLIIGLESFRPITQEVKPALRNLAAFGVLYGIHQWIEFLIDFGGLIESYTVVIVDVVIMTGAAIFLARFGLMLVSNKRRLVNLLSIAIGSVWILITAASTPLATNAGEFHTIADNFSRYIVILPANLLAAWGILNGRLVEELKNGGIYRDRKILAALLIANAVFSGAIAYESGVVPALWINDRVFFEMTGVPVSAIRASIAIGITIFTVALLRVFEYQFMEERRMKEAMEHDAVIAAEIQNELVPSQSLETMGAHVHARLVQARVVGGDAFDYFIAEGRVVFMVADASGKGSSAALLSTAGLITLETELRSIGNPKNVLINANERLVKKFPPGSFMTAMLGRFFPEEGYVELASCGQNPPLIYRSRDSQWRVIDMPGSLPLGIEPAVEPAEVILPVELGDRLLLYTDGLIDVRNVEGQRIGFDEMLNLLNAEVDSDDVDLLNNLVDLVLKISGGSLYDDVTVLMLNVRQKADQKRERAA